MKRKAQKLTGLLNANQSWIKYSPAGKPGANPHLETLWDALRGHDRAIAIKAKPGSIEALYQQLEGATLGARREYPDLGIEVQTHGRSVCPLH